MCCMIFLINVVKVNDDLGFVYVIVDDGKIILFLGFIMWKGEFSFFIVK